MASSSRTSLPPPRGEQQTLHAHFDKFFVIKLNEGSFASVSPFLIHKTILSIVGEVNSIRKLRSGDLLVQVKTPSQASSIIKMNSLGTYSVTVSPHASLNTSRGVISESELFNVPDSEILDNLREQNVVNVRRITIRRDGKFLPTKHLILTFNKSSLPSHIRAGYLRCPVRPFIPNPLRCFKCQRFGHSKDSCRGSQTCARCSQAGHESDICTGTAKCVNCSGNHPAYSRSCAKWVLEKEIQTLKVTQNLSFAEARRMVNSRTPTTGVSYASSVSTKKLVSISTQTDAEIPVEKNTVKSPPSKVAIKTSPSKSTVTSSPSRSISSQSNSNINLKLKPNMKLQTFKTSRTKQRKSGKNNPRPIDPKQIPGISKKQHKDLNFFLKNPNRFRKTEEDTLEMFASDLSDEDDNIDFMEVPPPPAQKQSLKLDFGSLNPNQPTNQKQSSLTAFPAP